MERETLYNILTGQYGEILETHAMWECISALGIKPFKDGNQWCFLYGENIQEGICGFGDTIYMAAWNFYSNIKTEEKPSKAKPSKNLKEMAGEWAEDETYGKSDTEFEMAYKGFKAGAEWAIQQLKGGQK